MPKMTLKTKAHLAAGFGLALFFLFAGGALAEEVGTIASMDGEVTIGRGDARIPGALGGAIEVGDEVRTGQAGRVQIVFQDDSVITLSLNSHLQIQEQVFDSSAGNYRTVLSLPQGKLRAAVSEYYQHPGAVYEITTATAVSQVHGTEFVITYDPVAEVTEIVGISGRVAVNSILDRVKRGVFIDSRDVTVVSRGGFPAPLRKLDDKHFRQYLEGLEFIGGGRSESLIVGNAVITGSAVAAPGSAPIIVVVPPPPPATGEGVAGVAKDALADRLAAHGAEIPDAAALLHQPPAVVQRTGELGIRF